MKNWKAVAQASGLGLSQEDIERIAGPLEALEEAFRPLVKELTFDVEPTVGICPDEGAE